MARNTTPTAALVNPKPLKETQSKRLNHYRSRYVHRAKNGVYDPYTYIALVSDLATLKPWTPFTAQQLAARLNGRRVEFYWDPVTVGRILGDLIDSISEANPGFASPIRAKKSWQGRLYEMTDYPDAEKFLWNLLEDLALVADETHAQEQAGMVPQRMGSPLSQCASLINLPQLITARAEPAVA